MTKENFFDFQQKLTARKQSAAPAAHCAGDAPLTVSALTCLIDRAIKSSIPGTVHVKGEVSNLNLHRASGHLYFTLKDPDACIDCVMFRSDVAKLKFVPADGIDLLASGRVSVYPQRGRYQLYVTSLHPLGRGALELAFQQLRERLQKQGLFDPERKKPPPRYPMRIALLTSRSTAALQDMLKVLRRFPWLHLCLYHVPVQGDGAAELIADALRTLNAQPPGTFDVILLARGGGSLEDLWEFNEECVARAIAASAIPVVTGIGHEVDTSIADLVADYHAHTPTEAAQVITSNWRIVQDLVRSADLRLARGLQTVAQDAAQRLALVQRHEFFRRPIDRIHRLQQLLDDRQRSLQLAAGQGLRAASMRLARLDALLVECHPRHRVDLEQQRLHGFTRRLWLTIQHGLAQRRQQIDSLHRHLEGVSPPSVLNRGYTITLRKKDGAIVRSSRELHSDQRIITRFADGTVESTVQDQKQLPLFE